jgi:hypothetical protein
MGSDQTSLSIYRERYIGRVDESVFLSTPRPAVIGKKVPNRKFNNLLIAPLPSGSNVVRKNIITTVESVG